jgi:hypothetical protein
MLSLIGVLASILPTLTSAISGYLTAQANAKVQIYQAGTGASRDVAVAQLQTRAAVLDMMHDPWIPRLFGIVALIYFAKCVLFDRMLGLGTTPDLGDGTIGWTYKAIVAFYFLMTGASMFRPSPK